MLDDNVVKKRFGHMFAEERVLRLGHFNVKVEESILGRSLYIHVDFETEIEHITKYSPMTPSIPNTHCFDLVTLSEVTHGHKRRHGLVGMYVQCGGLF